MDSGRPSQSCFLEVSRRANPANRRNELASQPSTESCNGVKIFRKFADSPDSKSSKSYGFSDSGRRGGQDFDKFRQSRGGGRDFGSFAAAGISAMSRRLMSRRPRFRQCRHGQDFGNVAAAEISAMSRRPRFRQSRRGGGDFGSFAAAEISAESRRRRFRHGRSG